MNAIELANSELSRGQAQPALPSTGLIESTVCWRQIGVFGDRSCPELQQHLHCHNCPVHSAAGIQLLNRTLPPGYRRERTDHFARQRDPGEASCFSAVLFRIGTEWLALPTGILQEATEFRTIHSVPHRRAGSVLGLANVRGELIICISLAGLLGLPGGQSQPPFPLNYHRLLIIQSDVSRLAFPVDEIRGPHRFHTDDINRLAAKPRTSTIGGSQAVLRWEQRAVGLLDPDTLLAACQRSFR